MANLVICCDGTWNARNNMDGSAPAPTNVIKFHANLAALDHAGQTQKCYYRKGVGTRGGRLRRIYEGITGAGLEEDVKSAYKWLAETYQPGDDIYPIGFSRGAYTVRSLVGMIGAVGLLDLTGPDLGETDKWQAVSEAMARYAGRRRGLGEDSAKLSKIQTLADKTRAVDSVPIRFLGVWDTVGSLGIPDDLGLLRLLFTSRARHRFHDTKLGKIVKTASHAVGMDEKRVDFRPTLWTGLKADKSKRDVKQIWFTGVHSDIGGGYSDHDLGDITLGWMMDQAKVAGLAFRGGAFSDLRENPRGLLHDSFIGMFSHRRTSPRSVPDLTQGRDADIAPSALTRHNHPPLSEAAYWPTAHLELNGAAIVTDVYASDKWARTGIYLRKDATYQFAAKGEWLDASIPAGPDGPHPGRKLLNRLFAYVVLAGLPEVFRAVLRLLPVANRADNGLSRRADGPWFSLIGVVANGDGETQTSEERSEHFTFLIGAQRSLTVTRSGYLYCYANDAWAFYENNRGKIQLEVRRIS